MKILVTGAAGYIGSVVTEQLIDARHEVIAIDDLRHGHRAAVHPAARFVEVDLRDARRVRSVFAGQVPDAVVHLAAEALIDESIRDPGRFFAVNVAGGLNLLDAMAEHGVRGLVFSSTAAVYGEPSSMPIPEDSSCIPVNSYGESKLAFERMLPWYRRAHGLGYCSLRYFNACGASGRYGEHHVPETHLIPILFEVALGRRINVHLYGADYDTPDGTCIRDYIHVSDIGRAHVLALGEIHRLEHAFNLGNGAGYSNRQVIEAVRRITGHAIPVVVSERRPGDPARLVASSDGIRTRLGWKPERPDLEGMIESAWAWRRQHPDGYAR